jgi:HSP20 family protein
MSLARFTLSPRFPTLWREFDEMVRDFNGAQGNPSQALIPPADVIENEKNVEIHLDLPGFTPEQIDVKLEGDTLTIKAERNAEKVTEQKGWIRRERTMGNYSRSFTLPDTIDGTKPEASFKNGVLVVTLPKREEVQPRSLKIKVEA